MTNTSGQYDAVSSYCRELYMKKMRDYGSSWRVLRPSSLTDQIMIKARRIRSIDEKGTQKVNDGVKGEFIGILNYSVMALIQIELNNYEDINLGMDEGLKLYDKYVAEAKKLMEDKNHDYGEAWRDMRIGSIDDIILMKLHRIKQIEDNKGVTSVSEGVEAGYFDMINYAAFALILIDENEQ
ncbi:MAG: DUF1599 domain-containing protein [Bacteroidota bacterium]